MEKIEKIQKDRDFANEYAKKFHCEKYLTDPVPTSVEQELALRTYFFERLKKDIANNLSILDAYFTAANNLGDVDDCVYIVEGMQDIFSEIVSFKIRYQESLCEEEEEEATDEEADL